MPQQYCQHSAEKLWYSTGTSRFPGHFTTKISTSSATTSKKSLTFFGKQSGNSTKKKSPNASPTTKIRSLKMKISSFNFSIKKNKNKLSVIMKDGKPTTDPEEIKQEIEDKWKSIFKESSHIPNIASFLQHTKSLTTC